ncbi:hypothetical protein TTHERM_00077380 (macronuclear) [Tetrahymena thermophila SB210]|uniref:Uncharacterized protein n=1 Tax=Tetrahymena thermophila (strain SB210) TaxID=312017 RepID=Q23G26_TETTS|nr:hypothetical protein TTHERM_00077380 [Tetrahymena thermophila SB210]EAR95434.1 hypothetical protein TTHERM_00077380 [Tetrahymena thermophila SB210]|eukprot:XP_001015679.1 hypothetical protein TTHERM_00077380 [Tetrahymena thermophila SB210]
MSHHYCNKHSQSPIRYKNTSSSQKQQPILSSSQSKEPASINIKIDYTSPFSDNTQKRVPYHQRGQQTESTHADLSPLLHQKLAQMQTPSAPFHFQNYVSTEGVPLRPQDIDQMKLRQEIAAREHELKLLAQMDYLIDLIKNLDQDRNVNIDQQKIEEIEKLKSDYQSINEDIQNLSFSQNLQASEDKVKRASIPNEKSEHAPQIYQNPFLYNSVGQSEIQPNQQILPNDNNQQAEDNTNLQRSGQIKQNQQGSLQSSLKSGSNAQNMVASQRENPLQQSIRSNKSTGQQQVFLNDPNLLNQQDILNNPTSLMASTQEQNFYQQNNPNNTERQLQSGQGEIPFDADQQGRNSNNQSQRQSLQNSISQSKKSDIQKDLQRSGVLNRSQQMDKDIVSSLNPQNVVYDKNDQQLYYSNQSNYSQKAQPQFVSSQHSLQNQQENQNSSSQAQLTGSYSLKASQKKPASLQQLYQSNPQQQLNQSNYQSYQQPSPAQQKLEQSIQTSMQLINSIYKAPNSASQGEKSQLEQQLYLYEKQIKELLDENECLKKNIADAQFIKKPLISAETKDLYSSLMSRGSRSSITQQQPITINKDQPESQIIQELQEALREKEGDLQILIQNITSEKDQNKFLLEENEILKTRLHNIEREAIEMQQQRQNNNLDQVNQQGLEAYSSVEGSNYDSNKPKEQIQDQVRRDSELLEMQQKQQYYSKRLSELEQEQKERSVSYQDEIARLNKLLKSVKDELGFYQAQHIEYVSRFNQEKTNKLVRHYDELLENEQIKNMFSKDMQDSLAATVNEQEKQIEELQKQIQNIKEEYETREKQLIEFNEQQNEGLVSKNVELEQDLIRVQNQAREQADQIAYLEQEVQQIKQRYIEIEMKKDNLILENNELKERIDQLEETRNQNLEIKEDAIKHITELQELLEQKNQEIERLNQQRDLIQAEYDELLKSLTEMENNLQVVQHNFSLSKNQHEQLKRETQELKSILVQKGPGDEEHDEIQQSIQELKKELNIQDEEELQQDDNNRKRSHHQNQNDINNSVSSKHSHRYSSAHSSARFMKESQGGKNYQQQNEQQLDSVQNEQQEDPIHGYNQMDSGEPQQNIEEENCDDCDMCMLEELVRQNENLKKQLLLKEQEIIELKTNPAYYMKSQAQFSQLGKLSTTSGGKGQLYLETNDQVLMNRNYESPLSRQAQNQNSFVSPQPIRSQVEQQYQQQQRGSLSNSKQPEQQLSSSQKQQFQQQQHQSNQSNQSQYQSYSVLQSEIEHLQKIFDQKCKEVDSWKKTYTQFYEQ